MNIYTLLKFLSTKEEKRKEWIYFAQRGQTVLGMLHCQGSDSTSIALVAGAISARIPEARKARMMLRQECKQWVTPWVRLPCCPASTKFSLGSSVVGEPAMEDLQGAQPCKSTGTAAGASVKHVLHCQEPDSRQAFVSTMAASREHDP